MRVLQAEPFKAQIAAVGLDSTELGWPPSLWAEAYRQAAEQGYRLSAHAGKPKQQLSLLCSHESWMARTRVRPSQVKRGLQTLCGRRFAP